MSYCVYRTTYVGELMPKYYLGSTSSGRIAKGYRGSVRSRKWSDIWNRELAENPHLFTTEVLSMHDTREEALAEELRLQKENDVVKSAEWINEALAQPKGFAGRDVSGAANPMYGRGSAVTEWCRNNPERVSERNRKSATTQWADVEARNKKLDGMRGVSKTRKTLTEEEFRELQRQKSAIANGKRAHRIEHNGVVYVGWRNFSQATGISKYAYKKQMREIPKS